LIFIGPYMPDFGNVKYLKKKQIDQNFLPPCSQIFEIFDKFKIFEIFNKIEIFEGKLS